MTLIRIIGDDGQPMHMEWEGELPEGAEAIERLPAPFEERVAGAWVVNDPEGLADWNVSLEHIARVHAQKQIEALLIKSGVALVGGFLTPEAGRRKITPDQMADIVNAKAASFIADELTRQDASINAIVPPVVKDGGS